MKVIPIIAQKGGANKTTLAINLCVAALQDDKEAMIIDLDLQAVSDSVDIARLANKPAVIILSAIQARGTTAEEAREALKKLGVEISPYTTAYRVAYINAPSRGLAVQEYEPHSKAAEEIKA